MSMGQSPDFRALFEAAPGLYLVLSPDLKILAVSDAYLRATMTQRHAILGKGLFEIFPDNPEDKGATGVHNLANSLRLAMRNKAPDTMAVQKYDIRKPDGSFEVRYWSPLNTPVLDDKGSVTCLIHRVEDVTEFIRLKHQSQNVLELQGRTQRMEAEIVQRAQEIQRANQRLAAANEELERLHAEARRRDEEAHRAELQARENLFRAAIEASQEAFDLMEAMRDGAGRIEDFRITQVNAATERLTGYKREQMIGKRVSELFPVTRNGGFLAKYIEVVETRRPWFSEFAIDAANVRAGWLSQQVVPVGDGVAIFTRDLTEQKKLEEQFRQAQKMESVGRLAGGIAHDFNNLLTVILGYAELAMAKLSPDQDKSLAGALKNIVKAGNRASELTKQLLGFARRQVIEPRVLDLNAQIADGEKMLSRVLGEDVQLVTRPAANLWNCKADPGQIAQVLLNLAINARDAMPKGGKLTIETENVALDENYCKNHPDVLPGEYVRVAVSDNGQGMSEETKRHVFEPFYTTKPMGQGTGLGLATCYGIVKQNGGHIWFYSELGLGTTFKVYLPRAYEAESAAQEAAKPVDVQGSEKVLLVEDEAMVREYAALTLRAKGYEVTHASDGQAALEKFAEIGSRVDLLVTDVVMPGMSGKELAEKMTALRPGLKVLFTSGYTADVMVHHGVIDEGVHYLAKPYTPTQLARKVREVLDGQ